MIILYPDNLKSISHFCNNKKKIQGGISSLQLNCFLFLHVSWQHLNCSRNWSLLLANLCKFTAWLFSYSCGKTQHLIGNLIIFLLSLRQSTTSRRQLDYSITLTVTNSISPTTRLLSYGKTQHLPDYLIVILLLRLKNNSSLTT